MANLDFPAVDGPVPRGPMGPTRLQLSKPVIAAIAGPAVAGGMELALWCDLRVMEHSAYMGVYCRRWGVPLIDGGTVRLPRIVGRGRALDIILTGRKVAAQECLSIGLAERLVPDGGSRAAAEALAHEIARFPQGCMRADRRSVRLQEGLSEMDGLRSEWACSAAMVEREGAAGAARFASGKGRHGEFADI
jgi:enoyl-CoA hydratase